MAKDMSNVGVLSGSLGAIICLIVGIGLLMYMVDHKDHPLLTSQTPAKAAAVTTNVTAVKTTVATNNPVKIHREKKEEIDQKTGKTEKSLNRFGLTMSNSVRIVVQK